MNKPEGKSASIHRDKLSHLYRERFDEDDLAFKAAIWKVLCERIFQPLVPSTATVLDLGAGTCEFINAIRCSERIVVDLNPDVGRYARGARIVIAAGTAMDEVEAASVDVVFMSNFLEHLRDKDEVLGTLTECHRVVRPGGRLIVLGPNVRYLPGRYWDYFDHHTPLTHLSLEEGLGISGFRVEQVVPRFLPYTVKDARIPRSLTLLRLYLSMKPLWKIFGRQMLVVARKQE